MFVLMYLCYLHAHRGRERLPTCICIRVSILPEKMWLCKSTASQNIPLAHSVYIQVSGGGGGDFLYAALMLYVWVVNRDTVGAYVALVRAPVRWTALVRVSTIPAERWSQMKYMFTYMYTQGIDAVLRWDDCELTVRHQCTVSTLIVYVRLGRRLSMDKV